MRTSGSWRGLPVVLTALGVAACGGRIELTPTVEGTAGSAGMGGSPPTSLAPMNPLAGEGDASQVRCDGTLIHVALGAPEGNSDFDFLSGCSDEARSSSPVAYFKGVELVLVGCANSGQPSPGIRMLVSGVSAPGDYSTNAVSFVAPSLEPWGYEGALPSNQLGWTTTIDELGLVGEKVSGHYIGVLQSGTDVAHLMGFFSVCRGPDQPER